ncbi:MAG: hypothetical protein CME36_20985 [unclassified Hahellaceae]|nr:hypothetical protein [Hahellaceae bacterium]
MNVRSMTMPISDSTQKGFARPIPFRSQSAGYRLRLRVAAALVVSLLAMPVAAETAAPAAKADAPAQAGAPMTGMVERTFCIWDPVGSSGPIVSLVRNAQPAMLAIGVKLNIQAYTDENIAANDFKGGNCDGVLITEVNARQFNAFTGTLGAIGAIPGDKELKTLLTTLAQPKAAKLMRQGPYEVAGILPIGSVFIFVRDRSVDTVEELQGKKMAVFENDPVAMNMVRRIGGSVVGSSLANFSGQFNNGSVDVIFAPAVAYNTMELYKGLQSGGGILDFPLLQTSMQIVIAWEKFPEGFGQLMRSLLMQRFSEFQSMVQQAQSEIPAENWIRLPEERKEEYRNFMRDSRIALMKEGLYDAKALRLMKKVRCKHSPAAAECSSSEE